MAVNGRRITPLTAFSGSVGQIVIDQGRADISLPAYDSSLRIPNASVVTGIPMTQTTDGVAIAT